MSFYADLHIHSKWSRACSRDCDLEHLALWAQRKGIGVIGTGDFTHPRWFEELQERLVPAEPGVFRLTDELERAVSDRLPPACRAPVRFLLSVEISTIYKRGERTRKVHHLVYMPDLEAAARFNQRLGKVGNITADGRPILGLDSRDLLEITLESGPGAYLVPAHAWTPWFSPLGSQSGFDSVEECYGDLADHVFALETGLSADPPMCWRVSSLDRYRLVSNSDAHSPPILGREASRFDTDADYFAIRRALETGEGYLGTVEFFPEEGKYHLDGHRKCGVCLEPAETRARGGLCPVCGKPLTVGVLHRVEVLADRAEGVRPEGAAGYRNLVPLPEVLGEILDCGPRTKTVQRELAALYARLGPELGILDDVPLDDLRRAGSAVLAEAVDRLRRGAVLREAGYDGEYGVIRVFDPAELRAAAATTAPLFEPAPVVAEAPRAIPAAPPAVAATTGKAAPAPVPPAVAGVLFDDLDPEQRAAAEAGPGPLLVVAGPGTGKTRTLTYRLAHLLRQHGAAPEQCLAISFTRRACAELDERLRSLVPELAPRVLVTTFHALGLRIVREQHRVLGLGERVRVVDEAERLAVVRELHGSSERDARRVLAELSRAKRARAAARPGPDPEEAPELVAALDRYDKALRARDLVDLDDLIALPVALLAGDAGLADRYRERWPWVAVDEYQDVDELQYRLLRLLAKPGGDLCAIGDPDQAIYGFRGADVGFFLRFRQDYPGARVVQLTRNYRSSRAIVDGALQVIAPASLVRDRVLDAVRRAEALPPRIVLHQAASDRADAEFVVRTVDQLLGGASFFSLDSGRASSGGADHGLSFADVAVLYRTDAQAAPLAEALARAGMPFQKRSHDRLADHQGVQAVVRALRGPKATVGRSGGLTARIREIAEHLAGPAGTGGDRPGEEGAGGPAPGVREAVELLAPLAERCGADLERFLAELALGAEVDTLDPRADRISLLTLHAAKGLEFPVVFLVGCEDGLLPLHWGGARPEDEGEERRLFFVGMTRARSHLFLSHAARRARHGVVREAAPSPYLAAIDELLLERVRAGAGGRRPAAPQGDQLTLI
ncbi:MAG TPA: UvrD-helicase domain-containing protein [Actinomycetota bacterium]|nr:UvrD-helicase domain-containing protein [Actinomycetota bacterium]